MLHGAGWAMKHHCLFVHAQRSNKQTLREKRVVEVRLCYTQLTLWVRFQTITTQSPRKGEFALHTHFRATKCSSYYDTTPAPRHCPNFGTSYTPSRVLEHQCQIEKAGKNPQTSTRSSDRTKDAIPPTATKEVHKADKVQGSRLSQGSTGTHSHARAWHYEMLVIVKLSGSIGAVSSARSQ